MVALEVDDALFEFFVVDTRIERFGPVAIVDGREAAAQPQDVFTARTPAEGVRHSIRRLPDQDVIAEPDVRYLQERMRNADAGDG